MRLLHNHKGLSARVNRNRSLCVRAQATGEGKKVFLTGGNTGIGYETAKALALQGYSVTIAARDPQKAAAAVDKIRAIKPSAQLDTVNLDLSDLASVRDCAARVLDSGAQYDVWINNAGVMATPKMQTKQGYEYQLGTNHLGHFLLTQTVLPALKASSKPVRIINVASAAHLTGKIDFDDLMREQQYSPWDAYGQSKLANIMYTYELVRRLAPNDQITVNALHPGVVKTELGRYMLNDSNQMWMGPAIRLASVFFKTPPQGAETSIHLASDPSVQNVSGKYYIDKKPQTSSAASYDKAVAAKLFDLSSELVAAKVPVAV